MIGGVNSGVNAIGENVQKYEVTTVIRCMRLLNMINGIALIIAGLIVMIGLPMCTSNCGVTRKQ